MNDKVKNIVVSILFIVVLVVALILNIFKEDDKISISERRKLEQFPKFSIQKLFDGSFFDSFDSYAADQFIFRDTLRTMKAKTDLAIKKSYHNIYVQDGYLIEQTYPLSNESVLNFTSKVTNIRNKYLKENNIYFSIIPDKNYFINGNNLKLDYNLLENTVIKELDFAEYINIFDKLTLTDYYKTDSHWKQENIEKVANTLLESMNVKTNANYEVKSIMKFKGAYAYQLPIETQNDEIKVLENNEISNAKVYHYANQKYTGVYDASKVNSLDKYDIYLSGAEPLLTIYNEENTSGKELLIFRDSYGSSLAPLLINSYSKITLIDTRYISPTLLEEYITFADQDVLFIYSVSIINNSYSLK